MKRLMLVMMVLIFSMVLFGQIPTVWSADPIIIKAGTWHPAKHRLTTDAFQQYGNEVEKRTGGKVKFKYFLAGSLVGALQSYKSLEAGLVDMMLPVAAWAAEFQFPITTAIQLPFLLDSTNHASTTLVRMYETIPEMRKEWSKVKTLGWGSYAITNFHMKGDPPKILEDLKGKKIISNPFPQLIEPLKLLGATPVGIKLPDQYMALQRGMGDGVVFPDAPVRSYKYSEIVNARTEVNIIAGPHVYAMNLKKWNSLPKDVQKVFEDLTISTGCLKAQTLTNEGIWVDEERKARGDKYYTLPKEERDRWREATRPMYDNFVEKLNKKGMDGARILKQINEAAAWARQNPCQPDSWWGRAGRK